MMARVADYLSSVSFYWPMVSAQDYGRLAPLHELDASFNNTVKHVQTETVMGEEPARYAVRMAEVIAGDRERMRASPPMSVLICTIAPLGQDPEGIEAGMVYAEAGIPGGLYGHAQHGGHRAGRARWGVGRGQRRGGQRPGADAVGGTRGAAFSTPCWAR